MEVIGLSSLIKAASVSDTINDVEDYLRTFECKVNDSVESFLHNNAISNEIAQYSRTSLVVDEVNNYEIIGYFSLLVKPFNFTNASGTTRKRLTGNKKATNFQTILIAQLGRSDKYKKIVGGNKILELALENCKAINELSALRVVCVEYTNTPYLSKFYPENGFTPLQQNEKGLIISYLRL